MSYFKQCHSIDFVCFYFLIFVFLPSCGAELENKRSLSDSPTDSKSFFMVPVDNQFILEAEDEAIRNKVSVQSNHKGFSGSGFGDFTSGSASVLWHVNFPPGVYEFEVRYGGGATRPSTLVVNEEERIDLQLPQANPRNWASWLTETVSSMSFENGISSIRIASDQKSSGPNLDHVAVNLVELLEEESADCTNSLMPGDSLLVGEYVCNGGVAFGLKERGGDIFLDLTKSEAVLRSIKLSSDSNHLIMQHDGNLVVYNKCGKPRWASGTHRDNGGAYLNVGLDGDVFIVNNGEVRFNYKTSEGTGAINKHPRCLIDVDPGDGDLANILAFGDGGTGDKQQMRVAESMQRVCAVEGCDFAVMLGDNIYEDGVSHVDDSQFITKFENPYGPLEIPFYVSLGNHDARGNSQAQIDYSDRSEWWNMPERYYEKIVQGVQLISLDTNSRKTSDFKVDQMAFVDNVLKNTKAKWKLVFGHHPIYSYGLHGHTSELVNHLLPILCQYENVVYVSGHEHNMQILEAPSCGLPLLVSGASAKLRAKGEGSKTVWAGDGYGYSRLVFSEESMLLEFYNEYDELLVQEEYLAQEEDNEPDPDPDPDPSFERVELAFGASEYAEEKSGNMNTGSSDLELPFDGSEQIVGLKYDQINIPKGSIIESAYIQFETDESQHRGEIHLDIYGEYTGNSKRLDNSNKLSQRQETGDVVLWSPPVWDKVGEAGSKQRSPDIAAVIQEIVNHPNWSPGHSLTLMLSRSSSDSSNNRRTAKKNARLVLTVLCSDPAVCEVVNYDPRGKRKSAQGSFMWGEKRVHYKSSGDCIDTRSAKGCDVKIGGERTSLAEFNDYEIISFGASHGGDTSKLVDTYFDANKMKSQGFKPIGVRGSKDKKSEMWIRKNSGQDSISLPTDARAYNFLILDGSDIEIDIDGIESSTVRSSGSPYKVSTPGGSGLKVISYFSDDSVEFTDIGQGHVVFQQWGHGDGDGFAVALFAPGKSIGTSNVIQVKRHDGGGFQYVGVLANFPEL